MVKFGMYESNEFNRMEKKLEKATDKAVAWLAADYKFMKEIKRELDELKGDLAKGRKEEEVREIKKALRDFKYVGRCERRLAKYDEAVKEGLAALEKATGTSRLMYERSGRLQVVSRRVEIESRNLIKNASLREGHIRDKLLAIREAIEKERLEEVKEKIEETEKAVNDSIKWIEALSSDLGLARQYHDLFLKEHAEGEGIEQIEKKLSGLAPEVQINYLGEILTKKEIFSGKTTEFVKSLLWKITVQTRRYDLAAQIYEKLGEWKLAGNACMEIGEYASAGVNYEKAKEWGLAGNAWMREHRYAQAAYVFEKIKDWYNVGRALMGSYPEKAAESFIKGGFYQEAAWCYEKIGRWGLAYESWKKTNDKKSADRAYQLAKKFKQI